MAFQHAVNLSQENNYSLQFIFSNVNSGLLLFCTILCSSTLISNVACAEGKSTVHFH